MAYLPEQHTEHDREGEIDKNCFILVIYYLETVIGCSKI